MTEEHTTNTQKLETKCPDYIARQYRPIRGKDGWVTRSERIGVAFINSANGSICFRPSGVQVIEGDIYFFPLEDRNPE